MSHPKNWFEMNMRYKQYTKSPFYKEAYNLCPNIHAGDLYCNICERVTQALEKAYQAGRYDEQDRYEKYTHTPSDTGEY